MRQEVSSDLKLSATTFWGGRGVSETASNASSTHSLSPASGEGVGSVIALRMNWHEPPAYVEVAVQADGYDLSPKPDEHGRISHEFVPTYHLLIMILNFPPSLSMPQSKRTQTSL